MCSICNQFACPIGCPNHREKGIYKCAECGDGISIGEKYYKVKNTYYHKDCLFEIYDKDGLLDLFGINSRIATGLSLTCLIIGEKDGK